MRCEAVGYPIRQRPQVKRDLLSELSQQECRPCETERVHLNLVHPTLPHILGQTVTLPHLQLATGFQKQGTAGKSAEGAAKYCVETHWEGRSKHSSAHVRITWHARAQKPRNPRPPTSVLLSQPRKEKVPVKKQVTGSPCMAMIANWPRNRILQLAVPIHHTVHREWEWREWTTVKEPDGGRSSLCGLGLCQFSFLPKQVTALSCFCKLFSQRKFLFL